MAQCPHCAILHALDPHLQPAAPVAGSAERQVEATAPGPAFPGALRFLGDYELLGLLAEGGMGQVYRARQVGLKREVALKVLHRPLLASPTAIRRFRNEVEVAAALDHPNILPVFEASEDAGVHFFGMRLAEGGSLAQALVQGAWRPCEGAAERDRLRRIATLVLAVADALHHAHQRGVIHRDLKPANILLGPGGIPLVADFGLAKVVEATAPISLSSEILGTPAYMAPEQLEGSHRATVVSDVYGLGAILAELITNTPPFRAPSLEALFEKIRTRDPELPRPRGRNPAADLTRIALACLRKEPGERYPDARAVADDLRRWLTGAPIVARPVTTAERVLKACRRHPLVSSLAATLVLSLVLGISGVLWQSQRVRRSNQDLTLTTGLLRLDKANALFPTAQALEGLSLLAEQLREDPQDQAAAARLISRLSRHSYLLPLAKLAPTTGAVTTVRWHPDGRHLLLFGEIEDVQEQVMSLWDTAANRRVAGPINLGPPGGNGDFSPDGSKLLTSFGNRVQVHHGRTLEPLVDALLPVGVPSATSWHPDSRRIVAVAGGRVTLLDAETGRLLRTYTHPGLPNTARVSPDGAWLALGGRDGQVQLRHAEDDQPVGEAFALGGLPVGLEFNREATRLFGVVQTTVGGHTQQRVVLCSVPDGRVLFTSRTFSRVFGSFSPEGHRLLLTDAAMDAALHDAANGLLVTNLPNWLVQHPQGFSPDGRYLVAAWSSSDLRLLDPLTGVPLCEPVHGARPKSATEFDPRGRLLAVANEQAELVLWQRHAAGQAEVGIPGTGGCLALSPDGTRLGTSDGGTHGRILAFGGSSFPPRSIPHTSPVGRVAFNRAGSQIAFGTEAGEISLSHLDSGAQATARTRIGGYVQSLAFAPDGATLVALDRRGHLHAFRTTDLAPLRTNVPVHLRLGAPYSLDHGSLVFHPSGSSIAVLTYSDHATLWSVPTLERLHALRHGGPVLSARFTRNGRYLATVSFDHFARIWDPETGREVAPRPRDRLELAALDIAPDDSLMATGGADRAIRVWSIPTGRLLATATGHEGFILALRFSPEGRRLASVAQDGTLRVWTIPPTRDRNFSSVRANLQIAGAVQGLGTSPRGFAWAPDGQSLVVAPERGPVRILAMPFPNPPAPEWLPALADAVAGQAPGISSADALMTLRSRLSQLPGNGFYETWVRWFFADRPESEPFPWMPSIR